MTTSQKDKAIQLHNLHHTGNLLIFPNIWDALGANLLESLNYKAVATASASIAFTNGLNDGEKIPVEKLLVILKTIVDSVSVPVTADIESGYATNEKELKERILQFLKTGIVGINIEDVNSKTGELYSTEEQCARIRTIRNTATENDIPLFINGRSDVLIHAKKEDSAGAKFDALVERGFAYKEAGADCFYPMILKDQEEIEKLVKLLQMPINILSIPGIPDLKTLQKIGIARVSLGPGFLKKAIQSMKALAVQLQNLDGLDEIVNNDITTDYLKILVNKKYVNK